MVNGYLRIGQIHYTNWLNIFKCFVLFRAAITKYHRLSGLNNRHLFLIALVAGRLKLVWHHGQVLMRTLSGRQTVNFLLYPHMREGEIKFPGISFFKDINSIRLGSPWWPNYLPNTITLGGRASTQEFCGDTEFTTFHPSPPNVCSSFMQNTFTSSQQPPKSGLTPASTLKSKVSSEEHLNQA